MSDATDLIEMGYGGPDGIDRLIDDCTKDPRVDRRDCYYFDEDCDKYEMECKECPENYWDEED